MLFASIFLVFLLGACGASWGSGRWFEGKKRSLARRASFELQCPESTLTLRPMGQTADGYDTVGVEGCERRAVYIYNGYLWIMNTEDSEARSNAPASNR